jgi:exosortase
MSENLSNKKMKFLGLPLASLKRDDWIRAGLMSIIIGLLYVVFHLEGNTTDIRMFGRSALSWMVARWGDIGGEYSHGWLIPLVSLGIIWFKRKELLAAPRKVCYAGLGVIIFALLLHWLGAKAQQTRLSLMGLILVLWGIPFYFYGWHVAKLLIFPCAYLIFCIPINFIDSLTSPLRIVATVISSGILNGLGIRVYRVGSGLFSDKANGFGFDVAPECSGLHSLLAMTALTAVYAYLTQKTLLKKWLLFLLCIPIALIGNIVRITLVVLVAAGFGQKVAMGLWHDYSGYPIFLVGISLMLLFGSLLNVDYRKAWNEWKQKLFSPTSS